MKQHILKIEMCNHVKYLSPVLELVKEFGKIRGLNKKKLRDIQLGTEEAIVKAIGYSESFCDDPIIVKCIEIPKGIRISVHDKGKPDIIDFTSMKKKEISEEEIIKNLDTIIMNIISDKIEYRNLGMNGREIVMEFYLDGSSVFEDFNEKEQNANQKKHKTISTEDIKISILKEDEALEMSKCLFEVYGYTYPKEDFYFPERVAQFLKNETIFCAIAKLNNGEVVGVGVINRETGIYGLYEYQSLIVKKDYRNLGIADRISRFLIEHERNNRKEIEGLFMEAVTNHTFSQKIAQKYNFYTTGFFFGLVPESVNFKGFDNKVEKKRVTSVFNVLRIKNFQNLTLYVPKKHIPIIKTIYSQFNVEPVLIDKLIEPNSDEKSHINTIFIEKMQFGIISIEIIGKDFENIIKQRMFQLKSKHVQIITIHLNMRSKYNPWAVSVLENYNFVFTGVLPGNDKFHPMLMQWFGGIVFDTNEIQVTGDIAKMLLKYIKGNDKSLSII